MSIIKKKIKKEQNRSFVARDFESIRSQLLETARVYFPDKIQDFSEPSVGGMFLDFVSTVGDSLNYYLDHAFRELDPTRAVETENIITHLNNSGVEIVGAAPAVVTLQIKIIAPAENILGNYYPKRSSLPVILAGTQVSSYSGIPFTTTEDIDFSEQDNDGNFICEYTISSTGANGEPTSFFVTRNVIAVSGKIKTETFNIENTLVPFREISLSEKNITTILSVTDSELNTFYEMSSLSDDTVFSKVKNLTSDSKDVPYFIRMLTTPYKFVKSYSPITQLTTIRFGSGDAESYDDDIIPDPSELSLNLYGKTSMMRFNIDPQSLLRTQTLGISPKNTALTVTYRFGGGLDHNVSNGTIENINNLLISFRRSPSAVDALSVRQSISFTNIDKASGGDSSPTLSDLQNRITSARKSQRRVVSKEDLLARIYTLPSEFGRVYKAAITNNPTNPLSPLLYIISRDAAGNFSISPDSLKKNLQVYLNELRLVGDSIDILDAKVINFGVKYSVYVSPEASNKTQVIASINSSIANSLDKKFFNINQPIVIDDITNVIINSDSVISLIDLQIFPITGLLESREYSTSTFDFMQSRTKGLILPDRGSIFEMKYPQYDIIGTVY
jgi:hypothetical protein